MSKVDACFWETDLLDCSEGGGRKREEGVVCQSYTGGVLASRGEEWVSGLAVYVLFTCNDYHSAGDI